MILSYFGNCKRENLVSRPAWAKWTGGVAQAVECLLCKHEALRTPVLPKKRLEKMRKMLAKIDLMYYQ
jgi:hypothetical protein